MLHQLHAVFTFNYKCFEMAFMTRDEREKID